MQKPEEVRLVLQVETVDNERWVREVFQRIACFEIYQTAALKGHRRYEIDSRERAHERIVQPFSNFMAESRRIREIRRRPKSPDPNNVA